MPAHSTKARPLGVANARHIVAGIATLKSVGFQAGLLRQWMAALGLSWLVAFPSLLVVLPLVRRIVGALVQQPAPAPAPR